MGEQNAGVSGHLEIRGLSTSLWLPGTMCVEFTTILWNSLAGEMHQVHRTSRMTLRWPNGGLMGTQNSPMYLGPAIYLIRHRRKGRRLSIYNACTLTQP